MTAVHQEMFASVLVLWVFVFGQNQHMYSQQLDPHYQRWDCESLQCFMFEHKENHNGHFSKVF